MGYTSSGYKHSLQEIMQNPALQTQLQNTKCFEQNAALEKFLKTLNVNPLKATYGLNSVKYAIEQGAVEDLLITNELFRNADVPTRKMYHKMVDDVRKGGGKLFLFSELHQSGERIFYFFTLELKQMTGLAATLKYALDELEHMD